jgi:hypothetical protein
LYGKVPRPAPVGFVDQKKISTHFQREADRGNFAHMQSGDWLKGRGHTLGQPARAGGDEIANQRRPVCLG